jgi:hypothetical protein
VETLYSIALSIYIAIGIIVIIKQAIAAGRLHGSLWNYFPDGKTYFNLWRTMIVLFLGVLFWPIFAQRVVRIKKGPIIIYTDGIGILSLIEEGEK